MDAVSIFMLTVLTVSLFVAFFIVCKEVRNRVDTDYQAILSPSSEILRKEEEARNLQEWCQYSIRDTERYRDEVAALSEQLVETRYLLAEICKALVSAHVATDPIGLYNDLERLAMECVRGYEECGHNGTPRCVPFPPLFPAGDLGSE